MPRQYGARASDDLVLHMLDLSDGDKLTAKQIAERVGITRNAVIGTLYRIRNEPDLPCKCKKNANKNGGMKRRWWK